MAGNEKKVTTQNLAQSISGVLCKQGLKRKGATWYLESPACICLLNLQRSQWGNKYYINLGVLVKQLGHIPFPKENQCHLGIRLSQIVPDSTQLERNLDFEDSSSSDEKRIEAIREAIETHAIPFLSSLQTLDGIKRAFREGTISPAFATANLKKFLQGE